MSPIVYCVLSLAALFIGIFGAYLFLELSEKDGIGIIAKAFFCAMFWMSIIIAGTAVTVFIWAMCKIDI